MLAVAILASERSKIKEPNEQLEQMWKVKPKAVPVVMLVYRL